MEWLVRNMSGDSSPVRENKRLRNSRSEREWRGWRLERGREEREEGSILASLPFQTISLAHCVSGCGTAMHNRESRTYCALAARVCIG